MLKKLIILKDKINHLPRWNYTVSGLANRHKAIKHEFHDLMLSLMPLDTALTYKPGNVKATKRIAEKVYRELHGDMRAINDILRSTFIATSFSDLKKIDETLHKFCEDNHIPYEYRNKFEDDNPGKFRSIMFKLDFGHLCKAEVQLSIKAFDDIYELTHERYEILRSMENSHELSPEQDLYIHELKRKNGIDHQKAWDNCKFDYWAIYGERQATQV